MLGVLAVAAALTTIDVPATLGDDIDKAKAGSGLDVYVPDTLRTDFRKLYSSTLIETDLYVLSLDATKNCGGGGACYVAAFVGTKRQGLTGKKPIKLHKGITGRYTGFKCGASCSPPEIQWKTKGTVYVVTAKGLPGKNEKRAIRNLANQAIDAGPR